MPRAETLRDVGRKLAGREGAYRLDGHQDPYRAALNLLRRAGEWDRVAFYDAEDERWRRNGIEGARQLAAAVLDELHAAGGLTAEHVAELRRRARA